MQERNSVLDSKLIATLASDIVAAYVNNNSVSSDKLSLLITSVYRSLVDASNSTVSIAEQPKAAVSVRRSVKPHAVVCLDCGYEAKMLKRHIKNEHGLTPNEYRARWNLPGNHPIVAPEYSNRRIQLAKVNGLGRKTGPKGERKKLTIAV